MRHTPLPPDHIQVVNVRPAWQASREAGLAADVLADLGLPETVVADPDGVVTGAATYAHMERIAGMRRPVAVWMDGIARHGARSLGVVGLAAKTLPTVADAMACHQRFQHLTNRTAAYEGEIVGDTYVLRERRPGPPRPGLLRMADYAMGVAVQLLQAIGGDVVPVRLDSRSPRDGLHEALETRFGARVVPEAPVTAVVLPLSVLARPVATADPELGEYFRALLERAAAVEAGDSDFVVQVRRHVQEALALGKPTTAGVSRALGVSRRTLQRRLEGEGQSFEGLLADTRRRLAEGYLRDPSLSLPEIAWLLGYRDETSFFRAFRRWTGTTPSQWRTRGRTGAPFV